MAENKKERNYTEAEKRRKGSFDKKSEELIRAGYHRKDLAVSVEKANLTGTLYGLLAAAPFILVFFLTLGAGGLRIAGGRKMLGPVLIAIYVLIVVHELIHGITWSRFVKGGFRNIEFGVIWKMLTPYCTCREPMKKTHYLAGAAMPCVILGVLPCIAAIVTHDLWLLVIGAVMILGAGGDLLIIRMALSDQSSPEALCLDHPTDPGLVIFDR